LDDSNNTTILPIFIKKTIQTAIMPSESTIHHHLTFTKIIGLIIIYVTKNR